MQPVPNIRSARRSPQAATPAGRSQRRPPDSWFCHILSHISQRLRGCSCARLSSHPDSARMTFIPARPAFPLDFPPTSVLAHVSYLDPDFDHLHRRSGPSNEQSRLHIARHCGVELHERFRGVRSVIVEVLVTGEWTRGRRVNHQTGGATKYCYSSIGSKHILCLVSSLLYDAPERPSMPLFTFQNAVNAVIWSTTTPASLQLQCLLRHG
jgi:hypothetical protein